MTKLTLRDVVIAAIFVTSSTLFGQEASQKVEVQTSQIHVRSLGTATLSRPQAEGVATGQESTRKQSRFYAMHSIAHRWGSFIADKNQVSAQALSLPSATPLPVVGADPGFRGFAALTGREQASVSGFDLEPPDQGLCTNGRFVFEPINLAASVYDSNSHKVLAGPVYLNNFFGVAPTDFTSDPRCYYDPPTQRWFVTMTDLGGPAAVPVVPTSLLLAVSQTSDPTGSYNLYAFDVTDDGFFSVCPCFGDQPLIGADANGFYISTNSFGAQFFGGAQIYALSKYALVLGIVPFGVHLAPLSAPGGAPFPFSLQPSLSPDGQGSAANGGTEYFVSSYDITSRANNKVSVWAMTGTDTLNAAVGIPGFTTLAVKTETYVVPNPASQKKGPIPLGSSLGQPVGKLDADDQRMQQVVYAAGYLWSSVTTALQVGGETLDGAAYFVIRPTWKGDALSASVFREGYIAVAGNNLIYPAIGVSDSGFGAMVFTLSGPSYFPSAAYIPINKLTGTASAVRLAAAGVLPNDGVGVYPPYSNGIGRWGDYSAAVAVADDSVWIATEYIGPKKRDRLTNWGTFIGVLPLPDSD